MEGWNVGRLEGRKAGLLEYYMVGRLEGWKVGKLESWIGDDNDDDDKLDPSVIEPPQVGGNCPNNVCISPEEPESEQSQWNKKCSFLLQVINL